MALEVTGIDHLYVSVSDFSRVEMSFTVTFAPATGRSEASAITRRFSELMGGGVTVSSTPGAGSVFTLTLPAKES